MWCTLRKGYKEGLHLIPLSLSPLHHSHPSTPQPASLQHFKMRTGILATLATASLALAAPLAKRENDTAAAAPAAEKANIDAVVLNCEFYSSPLWAIADLRTPLLTVALTLEHLEAAFYKQGLEKYSADAFASASFPEW